MQKQKRKVFTSKAIKAVKKKRRADLVEYRKSLNESNYLGIFTSVAGYVRRPRFYMPTKRHDLEASVSESKDISCCFVDATIPMRREDEKTNADETHTHNYKAMHTIDATNFNRTYRFDERAR